jgi:hypothetical protein
VFPSALFLLVTIFFFTTVLYNSKVPLWKSSQLGVLYAMSEPEQLGAKSSMEDKAKKTHIVFDKENRSLKHC